MKKILISLLILVAIGIVVVVSLKNKDFIEVNPPSTESWECDGDAMICPDGSAVGRSGPNCEFTECPPPDATSTTLVTYLGGQVTGLHLTLNPREIISDSRCPLGANCIWAGTVEVKTAISTEVAHGEHVFVLGEPHVFGDFEITLTGVTPSPIAGEPIPDSSYRFTFEVNKN